LRAIATPAVRRGALSSCSME